MPTKEKYWAAKARAAQGLAPKSSGRIILAGTLAANNITEDVLAAFPRLLKKRQPDPDQYDEVVSTFDANVTGRGLVTYYRVRTVADVTAQGENAYPSLALTLSDIRATYVAYPI